MDPFSVFSVLNSIFPADPPPTGCESLAPLCTCHGHPVTRVECHGNQYLPAFQHVNLPDLTHLDLSRNTIHTLQGTRPFKGMKTSGRGVRLTFSHNTVKSVDGDYFAGIAHATEVLDLSGNSISSLVNLGQFTSLEEINLSDNQLRAFPRAVCQARHLKYISLRANHIRHWRGEINSMIACRRLLKVYTDETHVSCDCASLQHYFYYHSSALPLYTDERGGALMCDEKSERELIGRQTNTLKKSDVCRICDCQPGNSWRITPTIFLTLSLLLLTHF